MCFWFFWFVKLTANKWDWLLVCFAMKFAQQSQKFCFKAHGLVLKGVHWIVIRYAAIMTGSVNLLESNRIFKFFKMLYWLIMFLANSHHFFQILRFYLYCHTSFLHCLHFLDCSLHQTLIILTFRLLTLFSFPPTFSYFFYFQVYFRTWNIFKRYCSVETETQTKKIYGLWWTFFCCRKYFC